jgi:tripartite-type tricarboxylate transporter receptor subunit TctC
MAYGEARPAIRHREPGWRQRQHRQSVVLAPADGYAFLLVGTANAISATLYEKLNFNFVRDIVPVAGIARVPEVMLVNPSFSATTVRELIAYGKANPGKLTMASGGIGTLSHVEGELFKISRALTDLLGGQVQVLFGSTSLTIEQIRAGKLRPLAVTTATRWEGLPDIPTVNDFVSGYEASAFVGLGAPRNTPAQIIGILNKEINAALADPNMKARLADLGGTVLPGTPADFGKLIADETEKWGKVIRALNIKAD